MSNQEVVKLAKELVKEIIEEMKREKEDKRLHNTRLLMRNYNKLKNHIENVKGNIDYLKEGIEDIEFEYDMELLSYDEAFLRGMLKTKMRTATMLSCIEEAMEVIEKDLKNNGEQHKFKAFRMHFIDKDTNENIIKELNCGKNSPKKWSDEIIEYLNILLWGIDALGI